MSIFLADEKATMAFGQQLAQSCQAESTINGLNIYLHGDLGAGKTTLVRGLIQYFLPQAKVKSPTYTLVEDYKIELSTHNESSLKYIHHFDLYRLGDPEELEYLGGRDYFSVDSLCLVEWPERGEGWLANADLEITLKYQDDGRAVDLKSDSVSGKQIVERILQHYSA